MNPATNLLLLLAAARRPSRAALGQLLEACRPSLLIRAHEQLAVNLQAKGDASDLVQDTMSEACRDFPQFVGHSQAAFVAWLNCILKHNAINFARHFRRTDKRQSERELSLDDRKNAGLAEQLCDKGSSPGGKAQQKEAAEARARAFERLSAADRRVIVLHYREERPFDEIARLMGRTPAAVRKLWSRAIDRWRQDLELFDGPF